MAGLDKKKITDLVKGLMTETIQRVAHATEVQVQNTDLADRMISATEANTEQLEILNTILSADEVGLIATVNVLIVSMDENTEALLKGDQA